jgi:indole-3-glycerol phosphate synthase
MKDFLKIIVEQKKREVAFAKEKYPEKLFKQKRPENRKKRPFFDNLVTPGKYGINIIAEIKRASPSKGIIKKDLDPEKTAIDYELGNASAISVLTDEKFFHGNMQDLIDASKVSFLPFLRKDFLISSYQIYESLSIGADAILLIAKILSRQQLKDYLNLAKELDLDALVEINSKKDLDAAFYANAKLIGINNRDLNSFETDIQTSKNLVSQLNSDQVAVCASGIKNADDIVQCAKAGLYNFLIGESIVRSENPVDFLINLQKSAQGKIDENIT